MQPHRFRVGAVVLYRPAFARGPTPAGEFVVERQLPPDGDGYQYRIESCTDGHRRIAHEMNLVRARSSI